MSIADKEIWLSLTSHVLNKPNTDEAEATGNSLASSQRVTPASTPSSDSVDTSEIIAPLIVRQEPSVSGVISADDQHHAEEDPAQDSTEADVTQSSRARKGHKKSRQGCYNCKRRKIKCQETQPACENCTRKNIQCTYPTPKTLSALQASYAYSSNPITSVNPQGTPTTFTLTDMRLFHHFLMVAYPHLPVGNDTAWINQVPLIAHHNEYLMHAILGMAASHLSVATGQDLHDIAIHHRILAIKGSNEAISKSRKSGADGDALLGACYALTFQSTYMTEGLPDFFQFVRGCALLSRQLQSERLPMAFFLEEKDHYSYMQDRLMDLPVINPVLLDGAEKSLTALPILFDRPGHVEFYRYLIQPVESAKLSSQKAYFEFIRIYQAITTFSTERITELIDPDNHVARILICHFLAIELVLSPIIDREWAHRDRFTPVRCHLNWMNTLCDQCPAQMKEHVQWPKGISELVEDELMGRNTTIMVLRKNEGYSRTYI